MVFSHFIISDGFFRYFIIYDCAFQIGDMMICPGCGEAIADDLNFCPSCGMELDSLNCPSCGAKNNKKSKYCRACGKSLNYAKKLVREAVLNSDNSANEYALKTLFPNRPEYSTKEEGNELRLEMERLYSEASFNDKKQLPLKIFGNSFFGSYGAPNVFNWASIDCAERTTCTVSWWL